MPKPCTHCQSTSHTAFQCFKRHRKPLTSDKPMKRSRIQPFGKEARRHAQTTQRLLKAKPPERCYIGGGRLTRIKEDVNDYTFWANKEHKTPKGRARDKAHNLDNLDWSCGWHNRDKGSRSYEEYMSSSPDPRCGH